jgi:hypothetical protein
MRKKSIAVVAGCVGAFTTVGVASAAWLVNGITPGTVQAANPRLDVQVSQVQDAYPGGSVPVHLSVTNPNSFPVQFGNLTFADVQVDPQHSDCPPSVLRVDWTDPQKMMAPQETDQFDAGVAMTADAPQSCVGATFQVDWLAQATVGTL